MAVSKFAIAGEVLGSTAKLSPGPGTAVDGKVIYATVRGSVVLTEKPNENDVVAVRNSRLGLCPLKPGSLVLARVLTVTSKMCKCQLISFNRKGIPGEQRGVLRVPDSRDFEVTNVQLIRLFRPGDVIRAKIKGIGEQSYVLSTEDESLGVIYAVAMDGSTLSPVHWGFVASEDGSTIETRKAAMP